LVFLLVEEVDSLGGEGGVVEGDGVGGGEVCEGVVFIL
jgi:hypothetical protein